MNLEHSDEFENHSHRAVDLMILRGTLLCYSHVNIYRKGFNSPYYDMVPSSSFQRIGQ